jgi:quinohemoprotein ethanol dehydrogenase
MTAKTWSGNALKKFGGGGSAWNEVTYDPDSGLLYFGTAGALPYLHHERSPEGGDNLFTSSVVAVRADTGEYVWHYQTVPEDSWEYNANMNIVLADLEIQGKKRNVLMIAPKNGFFYVLDRVNGELLSANNYVKVNWASHIDLETGRPVLDPAGMYWKAPPGTTVDLWPNMWGAHSTQPMAYHPAEKLVYIPAVNVPQVITVLGDGENRETLAVYDEVDGKPHVPGKLIAWDPVTQRERWSVDHTIAFNGGVLATAGGLVFQGNAEGFFNAYDAGNGKRLWSVETGSAITAAPVTYSLGGNQHVLISIGAGSAMQFAYPAFYAGKKATGPTRLLSFSLTGKASIPFTPYQKPVLPELQPLTASVDTIEQGRQLYLDEWCSGCHGDGAVAFRGGTVPDLRYASPATHQQWDRIVIGGAQLSKGMPAHDLSPEEAQAIRAWVISKSHELASEQP